jgi:hypothetical protein
VMSLAHRNTVGVCVRARTQPVPPTRGSPVHVFTVRLNHPAPAHGRVKPVRAAPAVPIVDYTTSSNGDLQLAPKSRAVRAIMH